MSTAIDDFGYGADTYVDPASIIPLGEVEYECDPDPCPICEEFDGERFDFDDEDKPLPPLHPNCRCRYFYVNTGDYVRFAGSDWEGW